MSSRAFLVVCEDCPPYEPASAEEQQVKARRAVPRRALTSPGTVEATSAFVDSMWCRDRGSTVAENVRVRARRRHG